MSQKTRSFLHTARSVTSLRNLGRSLFAVASLSLAFGPTAMAASSTWTPSGTGTQAWNNAANWSAGVPGATSGTNSPDTASFTNAGTNAVTIDAGRNVGSILFDANAGAYTIGSAGANAGSTLSLSSGGSIALGTTATSFVGTGTTETINAPLTLEGNYTFINNSTTATDVLKFAGNITGEVGTTLTLTLDGTNTGANTISSVIANGSGGAVSLVKQGAGTWVLSGSDTYSGGTTITNGVLNVTNNNALGSGSITLGDVSGSNPATLQGGIGTTTSNAIILGASTGALTISSTGAVAGTNTGTFSGNITGTNNLILTALGTNSVSLSGVVNNVGTISNTSVGTGSGRITTTIGTNVTSLIQNSATSQLVLTGATINIGTPGFTIQSNAVGGALINILNGTVQGTGNVSIVNNSTTTGNGGLLSGTIFNNIGTITISGTGTANFGAGLVGSNVTTLIENNSGGAGPAGLVVNAGGTTVIGNGGGFGTGAGGITGTGNLILQYNGSTNAAFTLGLGGINNVGQVIDSGTGTGYVRINTPIGSSVTAIIQQDPNGYLNITSGTTLVVNTGGTVIENDVATGTLGYITFTPGTAGISGTGNLILKANGNVTATDILIGGGGGPVNNIGAIINSGTGTGTVNVSALIGTNATALNVTSVNENSSTSQLVLAGGSLGTGNFVLNNNGTLTNGISVTGALNNIGTVTNSGTGVGAVSVGGTVGTNVTGITQNSATSNFNLASISVNTVGTTLTNNTAGTGTLTSTTISGTGNLTLVNNSSLTSGVTTTNVNNTGTVSNSGTGTGSVSISGSIGTLVSTVTQNSGTSQLNITNGATARAGGTTFVNNAASGTAILNFGGTTTGTGNLIFNNNGGIKNGITATGAMNETGSITNSGTGTGSTLISGVIGNTVTTVTQNGASTLYLTGTNLYTGTTSILAGTLSLSTLTNSGTNGELSGATNVVIDGGTLQYTGASGTNSRVFQIGNVTAGASGTIDNSGSGALTLTSAPTYGTTNQARTLVLSGTYAAATNGMPGSYLPAAIANNGTGVVSLTKSGTGKWTISGSNTYTGNNTINGGTLFIPTRGSYNNNTNIVNSGGEFDFGYDGTNGFSGATFTSLMANTTFNPGSAIGFDTSNNVAAAYAATVAGVATNYGNAITYTGTLPTGVTLVKEDQTGGGATQNTLVVTNSQNLGTGGITAHGYNGGVTLQTSNLVLAAANSYTGPTTLAQATIVLANVGALGSTSGIYFTQSDSTLINATTSTITTAAPLYSTARFDTSGNFNFTGGLYANANAGGGNLATFNNVVTLGNVYISATGVNANSLGAASYLNLGAGSQVGAGLTVNGVIANDPLNTNSNGNLFYSGFGNYYINGANTYTGTTSILRGTVAISSFNSQDQTTGSATLASSNLGAPTPGNFGIVIGRDNNGAGFQGLVYVGTGETTNRFILLSNANTSGTQGIDSSGSGALILAGNVFTSPSGGAVAGDDVSVYGGQGTFNESGNSYSIPAASSTFGLQGTNTGANEIQGIIQDGFVVGAPVLGGMYDQTIALQKSGVGTWILSGSNTYSGGTTITGGTLRLNNALALGNNGSAGVALSGASTLDLNGQTVNRNITLNSGTLLNSSATPVTLASTSVASLSVPTTTTVFTSAPTISISGGGGSGATATTNMGLSAASFTITGNYTVAPTVTLTGGSGSGATFTVSLVGGVPTLTFTNTGIGYTTTPTLTFSGGTFTTAATSTFNGFVLNNLIVTNGGTGYTSSPTVTFSGGGGAATTTANLDSIALIGTTSNSIGGTGNISYGGVISGTSTASLTKIGTDTVSLSGTSTYGGATIVSAGTLSVNSLAAGGSASAIGQSSNVAANLVINSGGTLQYTGAGSTTDRNFTLSGTSSAIDASGAGALVISGTNTNAAAATLNLVGSSTAANAMSGALRDNGGALSVTKNGTGTWMLTGSNTYTGATTVTAGTLGLGSGGALGSTAVSVGSAGTLQVNGNYLIGGGSSTASLSLASGGVLSMVDGSINTLTLTRTAGTGLTLASGSILNLEVGATADEIILGTGVTASVSPTVTVNIVGLGGLSGTTQTLISAPGGGLGTSNFALGTTTGSLSGYGLTLNQTNNALFLLEGGAVAPAAAYWKGTYSSAWNYSGTGSVTNFTSDLSGTNTLTAPPGSTTNVTFIASGASNYASTTLGTNFTINSLNFNTSGVGVGGTNTLTIVAGNANGNTLGNGITSTSTGGVNTISAPIALGSSQTFTVTNSGSTLAVSGAVSGAYGLTKAGSGDLVLSSNSNTYSGGTTLNAGRTIISNSAGSATGTGAVTVASGATLAGNGIIAPTSATTGFTALTSTSGIVAPGSTTKVNGALDSMTIDSTGVTGATSTAASFMTTTFQFDLGSGTAGSAGSSNSLVALGSLGLNFNNSANVVYITDLTNNNLQLNGQYVLFKQSSGSDFAGLTLSGMTITSGLSLGSNAFSSFYNTSVLQDINVGGGTYEIVVDVVPEPSTWAMMIGGLVLLAFYMRRRRQTQA